METGQKLHIRQKLLLLVMMAAATLLASVIVLLALPKPARPATDLLPDLGMDYARNLQIETTSDGRKLLRYNSIVVNVGAGPFEVHGERPDQSHSEMTTRQRIFDDAGGHRDVPTPAVMYFGGDGHNHWHVRDLEDFELIRLDNGALAGTGAKHGFCFYDNYRYGSTQDPFYTRQTSPPACGQSPDLQVVMGLSRGWGDLYRYTLPDQYIDITGLKSGRYRLVAKADADNWFVESNNSNNLSWINIKIQGTSVAVVARGPRALPISG